MRNIILALIAFLAIGVLMPAIIAGPASPVGLSNKLADTAKPPENSLLTTATQAAFLNDSWTPSSFVAPLASQGTGVQRNMTRNNTTLPNSTYAIYDFLNDNWAPSSAQSPIYTASAAGKDKAIAWTGESIYQFLEDTWTPATTVETYAQGPYKQHQMN
jgi:hypothetical protein